MIPTSGDKSSVSPISGRLTFHIIIDHANRTFSMDSPDGPSGVRPHYEMLIVARNQNRKLSDFMSEQKPVKLRSRKYRRIFPTIHFSELGLRPRPDKQLRELRYIKQPLTSA